MQVREAKKQDIEFLLDIENSSFSDPWSMKAFENQINGKFSNIFVCENHGELTGYLCYYFVFDTIHIPKVAVSEKYRKKGIASLLVRQLIEEKSKMGAIELVLEVRVSNEVAKKFYESLGFKILGERKKYYSDGEDGLMMGLFLSDKGE